MRPRDLVHLRSAAEVAVSPDGRTVVFSTRRIDLDIDAYRGALWTVPADGSSAPRPFTRGERDGRPAFSPDGRHVAFLRAGAEGPGQPWVVPVDGGEARQVADHLLGVTELAWSPDSRRLAYVGRVPEQGRYGTEEGRGPEREAPRRVTTLAYRLDGVGFVGDRRAHVFVVDALDDRAESRPLTEGPYDHQGVAWTPDGRHVVVASARHDGRDDGDLARDVWLVDAATGEARRVTATIETASRPTATPDGRGLVFAAPCEPDFVGRPVALFDVPADGSSAPVRRTAPDDLDADDHTYSAPQPLLVAGDGSVVVSERWRGSWRLVRVGPGGGPPEVLLGGARSVLTYAASADGATIAAVVASGTSAGEVVVLRGGDERTVTDLAAETRGAFALAAPVELEATADDGYPVHGFTVRPGGDGPFPVILLIHGGPHSQFGHTLFDEAQVLAGAGYAVVMANPRGSAGYGEAHGRAVVSGDPAGGGWGDRDAADLLAALDAAIARDPALDAGRQGVMGGSYGGYMTTWLLGHTDRFRAGISERAVNAFDSMLGTSDIGFWFNDAYLGADPAHQRDRSPLTHVAQIAAPTLIVHSENDLRCPLEQAQRLFAALRRQGTPAELLIFPGEGHELTRSGLPSHRVARHEAVLEWWDRHLARS